MKIKCINRNTGKGKLLHESIVGTPYFIQEGWEVLDQKAVNIADVNKDGKVDGKDLSIVHKEYSKAQIRVEEPTDNVKSYKRFTYKEVLTIAKEKGIKTFGKKKTEIITELQNL